MAVQMTRFLFTILTMVVMDPWCARFVTNSFKTEITKLIYCNFVIFSGMPTKPYLYANDFNEVLKQKHASGNI
ncbi:putative legumain protein [Helianthus annuus]|nr:putative legumain protein [Helianthus annuus]KAJ0484300.1 putative legumain protein [Helianthus annuus]